MLCSSRPRLLVVDDDLGVIAAYRLVLEKLPDPGTVQEMFGLNQLEAELFGQPRVAQAQPEWRVDFMDQGLPATRMVKNAIEEGDPYDAVFLDVRMPPGIDGYETAEIIRKLDPTVHIVIVTAYSDYTFEDFVEIAGPEELLTYLPKPVWPDQLRRVARLLASESSHRSRLNPQRILRQ